MITYCTGCTAPLSTTDGSCPSCDATATPQRSTSRAGGPVATGTITSSVTCDQLRITGTGQRLLVFAASLSVAVALAMLVTLVFVGGLLAWVGVLATFLPVLVFLWVMLLFLRMTPFGSVLFPPRRRRRGGSGRLVAGAVRGLTRIVVAPMRAGSSLPSELSTEVRRFRVTEVSGRQVDCELVGKLAGAFPQQGDIVDVFGRMTRCGTVRVRAVFVTSNQSRITARPHFGFVLARIANVTAVMLSMACVIGVAYLLMTR